MIIRKTHLNKSQLSSHHEKKSNKEEMDVDDFLDSFEKSFKSTSFDIEDRINIHPDQKNHSSSHQKFTEKDYDFKNDVDDINKAKFYKDLQNLYPSAESSKLMGQNSISLEITSKHNYHHKGSRIDQNDTCYDQIEQILNNMSVQEEFIVVQESNSPNMDKILETSLILSKNQLGISPSRKKLSEFLLMDPNLEKNFADNNLSVIEKSEKNKNFGSSFFKKDASFRNESKIMNNSGVRNESGSKLNNNSGVRNESGSKIINYSGVRIESGVKNNLKSDNGKKTENNIIENKENEDKSLLKSSSEPKIIHIQGGEGLIPAKLVVKENVKPLVGNKNHLIENEEKLIRTKNCIIY